ncbi:hypothetical protein [Pontibacillus sp. ALD_SL1]|uniref:hypothetical protein n=1 Tax=Pontibacillus sp. ALD_SL1 TaxID=2777185 RepID=UPI001F61B5DC|nr:hypothetical protein [Pontibacillus sp. ALD_SL1]
MIGILCLLSFGAIIDFIAKKNSINGDEDDGVKNGSFSEEIYAQSALYHMNHGNETDSSV